MGAEKPVVPEGWVVLREKSYRQAQERQRVANALHDAAERRAQEVREWALNCLQEERYLRKRCEYLYGLASSLGATHEQLDGPEDSPAQRHADWQETCRRERAGWWPS